MNKMIAILCAASIPFAGLLTAESAVGAKADDKLAVANNFLKNQKFDEAMDVLNGIQETDPGYTRALRLRGNLYFAKKDYASALKDFDAIILRHPRNARAYFERGIVHFAMENDQLAMDDIECAFVLKPELVMQMKSRPDFAKKIHDLREKAHKTKHQVSHKGGSISSKKGGLITKIKKGS